MLIDNLRRLFTIISVLQVSVFASSITTEENTTPALREYILTIKPGANFSGNFSLNSLGSILSVSARLNCSTQGNVTSFQVVKMSNDTANELQNHPDIEDISPNSLGQVTTIVSQNGLNYDLPRISHKAPGFTNYVYDNSAGTGSCVFILDSGYFNHPDFGGRIVDGGTFVDDGFGSEDLLGHGTHVAAIAGGAYYGIAKKAKLIAVKVCYGNGSCDLGGTLRAIDWVINTGRAKNNCAATIINMSFEFPVAPALSLNTCVNQAVLNNNAFVTTGSGNDGNDASLVSPASAALACTVGAIDSTDNVADFSNYGAAVKLHAPGVEILSAWIDSLRIFQGRRPNANLSITLDGTSQAAPHVAGIAANLFTLEGVRNTASTMCARIQELGLVSNRAIYTNTTAALVTPNKLIAYNGVGRGSGKADA